MAMWKMEAWDQRDEDELMWKRVKEGNPLDELVAEGGGWMACKELRE